MQIQHQYALKQSFIKIEFENSIRRLEVFEFFELCTGHQDWLDKFLNY